MNRFTFLVLVFATIVTASCVDAPTFPERGPHEGRITEADRAVLETIIRSYMDGTFFGPPPPPLPGSTVIPQRPSPKFVVVEPLSYGGYADFANGIAGSRSSWYDLEYRRVPVAIPHSAVRDFQSRNLGPVSFRSLSVEGVLIRFSDEAASHPWIALTLPGYSLNQEVAVLEVWTAPHGAGRLFYLRRTPAGWKIVGYMVTWIE